MRLEPDPFDQKLLAQQDAILASDPDNVVANCNKGVILLDWCRSEEALKCFERALRRDPSHARAWIGKGRALTMQEDYGEAEKCFRMVPEGDEAYGEAQNQSDRTRRYQDRRGRAQATVESDDERKFNDELDRWMDAHQDRIWNLRILLDKFRRARDGGRRKAGNAFHAWLVRQFYEQGGPLKVVAVECKNTIEPNTDVDIVLSGNVYAQVWYGKMPLGYTVDEHLRSGDNEPLDMDWCEELKPVQKKLRQLPVNTGKGFVINFAPGGPVPLHSTLHQLCSERQCVMMMSADKPHIIVTGTSDFKYRNEACQIARVLERPVRFILGDWDELRRQGRDPMSEAAYGHDVRRPQYFDLISIHHGLGQALQPWQRFQPSHFDPLSRHDVKQQLLDYARNVLKHPSCDDLAKMDCEELYLHLYGILLLNDSDCPDD